MNRRNFVKSAIAASALINRRAAPAGDKVNLAVISWFTWGFEDTALFAVKIQQSGRAKEAVITINGQACKETTCALIDDLEIRLPLNAAGSEKTSFDLSSLIEQGDLKDVRE
jgi:hypothetical protein